MFTIIGADGKEYGPVTADQIRQWMAENRLTPDMKAKRTDSDLWHRIRDFAEFAPVPPPPSESGLPPPLSPAGDAAAAGTGAAASVLAQPTQPREPITFTGDWAEYFKIWIVNVLLTIVTLGIYAAWAKVRKRRYFCANTRLFGHTFEYLADPVRILYGNLIVAGIFLALSISQVLSPLLYLALVLIFAVVVPWFIVRALTFNARNTAWRGLRFNFTGTYGESASAFLLWPMLMPFTMGLIYPLIARKQKEFVVSRHAYGTSPFSFSARTEDFFKIYAIAVCFFLPIVIAYFAFIFLMIAIAAKNGGLPRAGGSEVFTAGFGLLLLVAIPLAWVGSAYLRARIFNLIWNHTSLAGNRFVASMRVRDLLALNFINSLVTLVTLGLMQPWAAVRTAKFRVDSLQVLPAGNIDAFVASAQPNVSAIGDSAHDFFSFDIGFGV